MFLNVKYSQIESGLEEPLLENSGIHIPYLTPTWITSIRQFLFVHNMKISLTDSLRVQIRGKHDKCIMQHNLLKHYTPQQQTDLNLVRLFLQVITLSDMSTPDGRDICGYHLRGERRPNQKIRKTTWPRQETPTVGQKRLWRKYISSQYLRYSTKWKDQLGQIPEINRTPYQPYVPLAPGAASTLHEYVQDLPTWYRRLLFDFEQIANDVEVWKAFRAKRKLIIASDGSLTDTEGTFGWKLTTSKHLPLFKGCGPVDGGPLEIGSSTRTVLGP